MRGLLGVLLLCLLLCSVSACADALPNDAVLARFDAAETLYPDGRYWNSLRGEESGVEGFWSTVPCEGGSVAQGTCQSLYFGNGWQCWGFANAVAWTMFGSCPERGGERCGWRLEEAGPEVLNRLERGKLRARMKNS